MSESKYIVPSVVEEEETIPVKKSSPPFMVRSPARVKPPLVSKSVPEFPMFSMMLVAISRFSVTVAPPQARLPLISRVVVALVVIVPEEKLELPVTEIPLEATVRESSR